MIEKREHTKVEPWIWEVPTEQEGEQFFLKVLHAGTSLLVVQAMCTFSTAHYGDYACYIGIPPLEMQDDYDRAAYVAEQGQKLSELDSRKYGAQPVAPNGIHLRWRA